MCHASDNRVAVAKPRHGKLTSGLSVQRGSRAPRWSDFCAQAVFGPQAEPRRKLLVKPMISVRFLFRRGGDHGPIRSEALEKMRSSHYLRVNYNIG